MSYILICVRVAPAASDVQSISDIPATDGIHMEDRNHGLILPEPRWTMAYTPRKTVYWLAREQLHFKKAKIWRSTFPYRPKGVVFGLSTICIMINHTQTKHYSGNPYFLKNKRKILTSGKRRLSDSRRHLFFWKLPADLSKFVGF